MWSLAVFNISTGKTPVRNKVEFDYSCAGPENGTTDLLETFPDPVFNVSRVPSTCLTIF